jgi:tRNA-specific 2-thiouridylase
VRVLAAMSGGVDSAVAAARVLDAGHDVVGVHLALSREPATLRSGARGCCSLEDAHDARRVADLLGIPFYVWDLAERFEAEVIAGFVAEYAAGRTPNPCVRCNERIKFSALLDKALALGFDAVCTGHYARLEPDPSGAASPEATGHRVPTGAPELHRAPDPAKDQSYVLATLTPVQLRHALFPLGDVTKPQVRAEAAARELRVAEKPDSHDICFIVDGDTQGWLERRLGRRPGVIVDADGRVLGEHAGTHGFTVGQRKGLRLGRPAADGRPRYVLDVQPVSGRVVVGPREALEVTRLEAVGVRWCGRPAVPGERIGVQIRAHGEEAPAILLGVEPRRGDVVPAGAGRSGVVRVLLERPIIGAAPGQTLAMYAGTRVVGAATITTARP